MAIKFMRSRWLWYPLFGMFVFVWAGYCSVAMSSLHLPYGGGMRLPWLVRTQHLVDESKGGPPYLITEVNYYICLFGKVIDIHRSHFPTGDPAVETDIFFY